MQANTMEVKPEGESIKAKFRVKTMSLDLTALLAPIDRNTAPDPSSDAPSHDIEVMTREGELIPVGKAWTKAITRGPNEGKTFFSLQFQDPDLPAWNFAAFPTEDNPETKYDVVVKRRREAR